MKKLICASVIAVMALCGCSSSQQSGSVSSDTSSSAASSQAASSESAEEQAAFDEFEKNLFTEGTDFPQLDEPAKGEEIVVISTSMGDIKIKLCPDEAPKAVENFKGLVEKGYYDGLIFHRVIDGFMIQSGSPNGDGIGGESIWGGQFDDELNGDMYHFRGALAYANSGANTNSSQFYIVQSDAIEDGYFEYTDQIAQQYGTEHALYNSNTGKMLRTNYSDEAREKYEAMGGTPFLDFGYTVFGQVFEGMDVVDAIASVETVDNGSGEVSKPVEEIIIQKAEVVKY